MGANAQTSVPVFVAGQVLTAQQQKEINTGIPVFATTTTRDAAFGGAGEKTLAQGQTCYIEATSTYQTYNGSAWVSLVTAPGLTLIKTQTIGTAVSSVNVTSAFSATYDRYLVTLSGGTPTTGRGLNMTLGATTTGYYSSYMYVSYNTSSVVGSGNSNGASIFDAGVITTNGLSGRIEINNPFNSVRTEIINYSAGMATTNQALIGGGYVDNNTSYTDFTLTMASTGTMTGGTIYVYGYAKA